MQKFKNIILILMVCLAIQTPSTLIGQSLSPDRPGFSFGTHAATPGTIYLEMGYEFSFRKDVKYSSLPSLNLKFGIMAKF
ncbi:MAG: hypothetical protein KGZ97_07905 [Bacteroidetes bacterium]|nr:hypothetical protein [Bacteroidota bacterium]